MFYALYSKHFLLTVGRYSSLIEEEEKLRFAISAEVTSLAVNVVSFKKAKTVKREMEFFTVMKGSSKTDSVSKSKFRLSREKVLFNSFLLERGLNVGTTRFL